MSPLEIAGLTIFILVLFAGIFSTVFGLPGTLIILLDVILYALCTGFERIGFKIIAILFIIALLAETLDFALLMAGAARFWLSKRMIWASVTCGIIGAVLLTPALLGLGIIAGAFLGGFTGMLTVELIRQYSLKPAFRTGYRAILGRSAGILLKGFSALAMTVITLSNVYS
ncbi:MAG: hypothetical protein AUK24_09705 [Syntrophaceae bacterium CG2_30_49_12]|nr:MAG: hypothetical protein AUK24_09705 [Syntrophaceae bacterium CG2_30_49_12]PIP05582.1 MAG: hypothetical protein COX52_11220 [Syntrophobacterales bacterium CG23_combo_of_CG06-09_8_20_14_all_48_27]